MIPLDSNAQLSESSVSWDDHRSGELFPVDKVMNELLRDLAPALTGTLHYELVTFKNITELRNINAILFPMSYQDRYYKEVLAPDSLARLVFLQRHLVGTFSCRLQVYYIQERGHMECYIMTVGVLAPYRRLRLGTVMLKSIIAYYRRRSEVKRLALHVHTINEAAIRFYELFGFKIVETLPNYYRRLSPSSAHHLVFYL